MLSHYWLRVELLFMLSHYWLRVDNIRLSGNSQRVIRGANLLFLVYNESNIIGNLVTI